MENSANYMREKVLAVILECILKLGFVSKQGFAEFTVVIENHKIVKYNFNDKVKVSS